MSKGATCDRKNSSGGRVLSFSALLLTRSRSVRILSRSSGVGGCAGAGVPDRTNHVSARADSRGRAGDVTTFMEGVPRIDGLDTDGPDHRGVAPRVLDLSVLRLPSERK